MIPQFDTKSMINANTQSSKDLAFIYSNIRTELSRFLDSFVQKHYGQMLPTMHILSGQNRATTKIVNVGLLERNIESPQPYSGFENARSGSKGALGTHAYMSNMVTKARREFGQAITITLNTKFNKKK